MDAIVDTGAVLLVLSQEVVEVLGLEASRTVVVTCATDRKMKCLISQYIIIENEVKEVIVC